jgi:hypothetical protein
LLTAKAVLADITYGDDGTAAAAEGAAELQRFFADYFGNGELHIYNSDTGELISRKDAFMPVNMMANPEGSKQAIRRWLTLAERRHARTASLEHEIIQIDGDWHISLGVRFGQVQGL